jgi:hypothetical protein
MTASHVGSSGMAASRIEIFCVVSFCVMQLRVLSVQMEKWITSFILSGNLTTSRLFIDQGYQTFIHDSDTVN